MENFLLSSWATLKKNQRTSKRAYPFSFMLGRIINAVGGLLFPITLYYLVFDKQMSGSFVQAYPGITYISYITLGSSALIFTISTIMSVSRSLIMEMREGTLHHLLLSPMSRAGYFVGVYLEQLIRSIIELGTVLIFGILFGARIGLTSILPLIIFIILFSFTAFCLAILISNIMLFSRDTFITQNTLLIVLTIFSGAAFPTVFLPSLLRIIANLLPTTQLLNAFRNVVILKHSLVSESYSIFYSVSISVVVLIIGLCWYKKLEQKLVNETL
ncbi:ABC transporter permease [Leuconostoc sp. MS02]|uniref:Transport permease protein n=1 Tax=Leuconostoc aquikimchii TaxID=3236804 RepID=A0ABV3S548_9LACO